MSEEPDDSSQIVGEEDLNRATAEAIVETVKTGAEVHSFRRIATRFSKWELPRSFVSYRADPITQTSGSAPKWVLKSDKEGQPQYIVKLPYRYGLRETLTELLINQLGLAFGFDMAHSGLVSVDGNPAFVSRSFLGQKDILVHGVFLIEEVHELPHGELEKLPRGRKEQEFYSIDFVIQNIEQYCGNDAGAVITKFVEMLLFDALIGATDRHAQNWGVIRASTTHGGYRFSPIFDTSRGLFWNLADDKLQAFQKDEMALRCHIDRACPVMGPERKCLQERRCNHFGFIANLFAAFPRLRDSAVTTVTEVLCSAQDQTATILDSFPFRGPFSKLRRSLILKLIALRGDMVSKVLAKGGEAI